MKITEYDRVTSLDSNDIFLIDGNRGTKKINQSDVTKETKVLKIGPTSISQASTTITDARITSDMIVVGSLLSNPAAQTGDWTVTTAAGSAVVSGNINGTTNLTLYLEKCINP